MRLKRGQKMPNITYQTAFKKDLDFINDIKGKKTIIMFLRYYGCTICKLDLIEIEKQIEDFKKNNIDIKIVLQSDPKLVENKLKEKPLSFDIICDPNQKLYKKFEINPANSKEDLAGGNIKEKIRKVKKLGIKHGKYEGEELQLPAVIIINKNGEIVYSHYGDDVTDIPSPQEILTLAKWLK